MRRYAVAAAVAALLMLAGARAAESQIPAPARQRVDPRDLELLHGLARANPRIDLPSDVRFRGPGGRTRHGVRCATRRPSDTEVLLASDVARRVALGDPTASDRLPVRVPVVFHVVRTRRGKFDVSRQQILDQIEVLNDSFRSRGFDFELLGIRRHDDSRFAKRCGSFSQERRFKRRNAVHPERVLNVYTCRPSDGVLGYAWLPSDWDEDSEMHGAVVRYSTLPGGAAVPYDEGDTLVHEVGHWAGLYHTFQGGCRGGGDQVDDTPAEASPAYGCPAGRDSCPALSGDDPLDNFMDYSDDVCMNRFTAGQRDRMLDQTRAFRPSLAPVGSGS